MVETPTVSVVLPTLNEAEYISGAIDSILNQTLRELELIIIDGGSSDGTIDIIESKADSRMTLIKQTDSKGLAVALNRGIDASSAPYVARMDADDRSRQTRLEKQVALFNAHESLVLVSSWCQLIGQNGEYLDVEKVNVPDDSIVKKLIAEDQFVRHGSLVFRRDALTKLGGYRPAFDLAEDYDLLLRLFEQYDDTQFQIVPEILYDYRISPRQKIKGKPQDAVAEFAREASIRRQRGKKETEQIAAAKRARETIDTPNPTEAELTRVYHEMVGNCLFRNGRIDAARRKFRRALRKDPTSVQALKGVLICYLPPVIRDAVHQVIARLWRNYRRITAKLRIWSVE